MDKEDVVYTHNGKLHSKKMKFCHLQQTWVDLEATMLSEIRKTKKDKYMISDICGIKIK